MIDELARRQVKKAVSEARLAMVHMRILEKRLAELELSLRAFQTALDQEF